MSERDYLDSKISEVQYDDNRFTMAIGSDKYIFGIISAKDSPEPLGRLLQYKTIYDTLKDIDAKLKISFENAIEYAYSAAVQDKFNIFKKGPREEMMAYYYIENALFRTATLWDLLAQLYRLYYTIEVDAERVYYNKIFNPRSPKTDLFKDKAKEINDYIHKEDNIVMGSPWEGNHGYVNDCRNKMVHRNSPNVAVMSDYDLNLKKHPSYMLKRIIEDYSVVSKFIAEILDVIEIEEIMKLDAIND